ncbi:MAG: antitoxin [Acidobacteriota bacterium]
MRITLTLDDDVVLLVRGYAEGRSLPFGKAVSELIRRGFSAGRATRMVNGLLVFDLPTGSPRVTTSSVRDLEADER